jgi:hypothetical protein
MPASLQAMGLSTIDHGPIHHLGTLIAQFGVIHKLVNFIKAEN